MSAGHILRISRITFCACGTHHCKPPLLSESDSLMKTGFALMKALATLVNDDGGCAA